MKKVYKILLAFLTLIVVFAGTFIYLYQSSIQPLTSTSNKITFNIAENTYPNTVLTNLEEQGVIKNAFFAKLLMKQENLSNIKAGIYEVDSSWSTKEVLEYINIATNAITDEVLLTIPEGNWAKDIARKIEEVTNVSAEDCLKLWNHEEFLNEMIQKYDFLTNDIYNDEYRVKLEGYLYPDSYYVFKETTAKEITIKLLDRFDQTYQSLKDQINKSKYSIHEIVTFASVVQFESGDVDQMPIISSIFENRFDVDMNMGASATVCYALYEFDDIMDCESNPDIDSPYNTYLYDGLPIGPVNNPSYEAIHAVLNPEDTDYYYFISDIYGDGKLIPAKTYEEHLKNIEEYLN